MLKRDTRSSAKRLSRGPFIVTCLVSPGRDVMDLSVDEGFILAAVCDRRVPGCRRESTPDRTLALDPLSFGKRMKLSAVC